MTTTMQLGFDGAYGTDTRPAHQVASHPWAKDPSSADSDDGTRLTASWANAVRASMLAVSARAGLTWLDGYDDGLADAVAALADTAARSALDGLAPLISPEFLGAPKAPTAPAGNSSSLIANTSWVRNEIAGLVNAAPGSLDTLRELADALGDDPNFSASIMALVATKVPIADLASITDPAKGVSLVGWKCNATGAVGRTLYAKLDSIWVDPRDFGAVGNNSADDAPKIQAAINYAQITGKQVWLGPGQYRLDSGLSITQPITLRGIGCGAGPGGVTNSICTQFLANFAAGDVIRVSGTLYGVTLEGFQVNTQVTRTSGAGIAIDGSGIGANNSNNANSRINNVATSGQFIGINLTRCSLTTIFQTYHQAWVVSAIETHTNNGIEVSAGTIRDSYFFGSTDPGTTQAACIRLYNGYCWIVDSTILGAQKGIHFLLNEHAAGGLHASGNSLEEQTVASIYAENGSGITASHLKIVANEFSTITNGGLASQQGHVVIAAGAAPWLDTVTLSINEVDSQLTGASAAVFTIASGTGVGGVGNVINTNTGTAPVWSIGAQAQKVSLSANKYIGTGTRYTGTTSEVLIDDADGVTVAALPPTVANGSRIWCPDGMPGSAPVTGSGPGTWAERKGGVWCSGDPIYHSQYFSSSGTFTAPAGTNAATVFTVTALGGGGGGEGGVTNNVTGGGGGAGARAVKKFTGLVAGSGYAVTIGAAGTAGAAGGTNGGNGGDTTFVGPGGTTLTAGGGKGGGTSGDVLGGNGGTATGADVGDAGSSGGNGREAGAWAAGGQGASSPRGGGSGRGGIAAGAGQDGQAPGAGGGGGAATTSAQGAGGAGKAGDCLVEWVL